MDKDDLFEQMAQSIIDGEPELAEQAARDALALGIQPLEAIHRGFIPGMEEVGQGFGCGDLFLPDLVRAAAAMKAATSVLEPEMIRRGDVLQSAGTVVLGTIKGDVHEIGKNLVGTMFIAAGFEVHDLGVDVPCEAFVAKAREVGADIVGISALLTTTMANQRQVIEALEQAGLRQRVKVLVGGAPVTPGWAKEIGADGYAEDAIGAVNVARELLAVRGVPA
jgi:corrinoid protein of di/trimethylamine methyltransferase